MNIVVYFPLTSRVAFISMFLITSCVFGVTEEEIPYEEQSLSPVNIKSPDLADQLQLDVKSPDLKPDEPREEDLLPSAYEQVSGRSLCDSQSKVLNEGYDTWQQFASAAVK